MRQSPRIPPLHRLLAVVSIAFALFAVACTSKGGDGDAGDSRRRVVIDYNPTQSDIGALLFVLARPEVRVAAITIPGTGESHCEHAVATTRGVLEALDAGDIPVACGRPTPLAGANAFPDAWRAAADEMAGLDVPRVTGGDLDGAVELLRSTIAEGPVTLLTLGPLTNIGEAVEQHPEIVANLEQVYVMGGAVYVDGNVFANTVAEWNVWVDPRAAGLVLGSGAPVTLIPLDATNDVPVDANIYRALFQPDAAAPLEMMQGMAGASPEWYSSGGFYLWDELAAGVMLDDSYVTIETERVLVEETGDQAGRTRIDPAGNEVGIAVSADRARFTNDLVSAWAGEEVRVFEAAGPELAAYAPALQDAADAYRAALDAAFSAAEAEYPTSLGEDATFEEAKSLFLFIAPRFRDAAGDLHRSLQSISPSPGIEEHAAYVTALDHMASRLADLVPELQNVSSFAELDALLTDPAIEDATARCQGLQEAVGAYGLLVDLYC